MSMNKRDEGKMKEVIGSVEEIVLEVPDDASANISEDWFKLGKKQTTDNPDRRHDLAIILKRKFTAEFAETMIKDLKVCGFDCVLVECKSKEAKITTNGKSEYIKIEDQSLQRAILLSYNDEDAILRQAENLRFRKFK